MKYLFEAICGMRGVFHPKQNMPLPAPLGVSINEGDDILYIDHTIDKKMIARDMSAVLTDLDLAITDAKKGRR
jgi:hypothetical protein